MDAYLNTMRDVLENGVWQKNERTGEMCCSLDGAMTRFDLRKGFPAVTTKPLAWKSVTGEFCGFLRGVSSAADFRALGSKIWDANANENAQWLANPFRKGEDDLGDIYGVQWRRWPGYKLLSYNQYLQDDLTDKLEAEGWELLSGLNKDEDDGVFNQYLYRKEIDQLGDCIRKIILTPSDRRILFHGWNPAKLDEIALPACHLLYQFLPSIATKELSLTMYIRSWDCYLGGSFNIAEGALLCHLVGRLTGYTPKHLTIFSGDTHIYKNSLSAVQTQLARTPFPAPHLLIDPYVPRFKELEQHAQVPDSEPWPTSKGAVLKSVAELAVGRLANVEPTDFHLVNYQHHPAIEKVKMAV